MSEIAPALERAIKAGWARFLAFYCDHPDGEVRFWTRTGAKRFAGHEWIGCGRLGRVYPIARSTDLVINEVTFELRGVPPTVEMQLSDKVRNRIGRVWLGAISPKGAVILDDDPMVDAVLDYQRLTVDPSTGSATIKIIGQQGFYILDRAQDIALTDQQQRFEYEDDCGMALIHMYETRDSNWRASDS